MLWKVLGLFALIVALSFKDARDMLKQGVSKKEGFIFLSFISIAFSYSLLILYGVPIPSPLKVLEVLYRPISDVVYSFLS